MRAMSDPLPSVVSIEHFSDVLCVWAYCADIRVAELRAHFGERVALRYRFLPVFGSTASKLGIGWAERGGFPAYAAHVRAIVGHFPHVTIHPDAWEKVRPASSSAAHLFLKAVQRHEGPGAATAGSVSERAAWAVRLAFFRDARDVAQRSVQLELAEELGLPRQELETSLADGTAMAALFDDVEAQSAQNIVGSPTLVFNEGRQKLYGNVGYRVIAANIEELLHSPKHDAASWC
jgi:predicted DsbA family dithiol-disulfide isomerase